MDIRRADLILEGIRLDFANHIENGAVARFQNGDDLIFKLNRIGTAYDAISLFLQRFNRNMRNPRVIQALNQIPDAAD